MLTTNIKVCGMRVPTNIVDVSELEPDYLGFIFYPKSKRYVSDEDAGEIIKAVPAGIRKVGVFVNEIVPEIVKKVDLFGLDVLQFHGNESPGFCEELKSLGYTIVKAFGVDKSFDFDQLNGFNPHCDYFLFDTKSPAYGGTGIKFDWELLKGYDNSKPIFLSGGIGPNDAEAIQKINGLNIHALDINSKFETEPAFKDIALLKKFFAGIRG